LDPNSRRPRFFHHAAGVGLITRPRCQAGFSLPQAARRPILALSPLLGALSMSCPRRRRTRALPDDPRQALGQSLRRFGIARTDDTLAALLADCADFRARADEVAGGAEDRRRRVPRAADPRRRGSAGSCSSAPADARPCAPASAPLACTISPRGAFPRQATAT